MTPLERAAEALHIEECRAHGVQISAWSDVPSGRKSLYRDQARAVIKAIREPSEGMADRASFEHYGSDQPTAEMWWRLMIDQLLAEIG